MMKKTRIECVPRKQPIISERKNTREDVSLLWRYLTVDATDKKTKVKVSNMKKEREDVSATVKNNSKTDNNEKQDMSRRDLREYDNTT